MVMKVFLAILAVLGGAFAAPSIKIAGGQSAVRNQFPYQASMQWGFMNLWQHLCGGSIIAEQWIVTAAHCITDRPPVGIFRVRVGLLNLNDNESILQTAEIESYIVHEDYIGGVGPTDIALVKLSSSLQWTESVQPIGLPAAGSIATGDAVVSGWGSISITPIPTMPNTLQFVTVPVLNYEQCANALIALFGSSAPLAETNVCSGPLTGGIAACTGDSGGPLTQNNELIGVVSWGITPCGAPGAPSVYVQVSSYVDWINNNINQ